MYGLVAVKIMVAEMVLVREKNLRTIGLVINVTDLDQRIETIIGRVNMTREVTEKNQGIGLITT